MSTTRFNSPLAGSDNEHSKSSPQAETQGSKQTPEMGTGRKKRTRTGCVNCSRRRRKCDEAKPTCTGCKRRGDQCQWRMLGSFRDSNIKVLGSDHPSMSQGVAATKSKRHSKFKILNALPTTPRTRGEARRQNRTDIGLPNRQDSPSSTSTPDTEATSALVAVSEASEHSAPLLGGAFPDPTPHLGQGLSPPLSSEALSHISPRHSHCSLSHHSDERNSSHLDIQDQSQYQPSLQCDFRPPSMSKDDSSSHAYINSSPEYVIDDLAALRDITNSTQFHSSVADSYQTIPSPLFDHGVFSDPADFVDDVFLPGSAYEALHKALRNRQLWTARPNIPSHRSSPESVPLVLTPTAFSDVESLARAERNLRRTRVSRRFELSPDREDVLWQNYLNEICSWLDMFDNNRHFASTFPQMAKSAPHLRYSILALSARQLERQQNEKSQSESLSLYQEAIHLLLPELGSKTVPVIASCVILCVLEMLSCNPKEWRRHLDGCAYLIQAAGINGFSGKEEQALFWCFARMDVCGGLISEEETIIPIHNWRPNDMNSTEVSQIFLSSARSNSDIYANYTVYLAARTLGVLFGCASKIAQPCTSCQSVANEEGDSYVDRWKELFNCVEQWYENRPSQMKSIFSVSNSDCERVRPFPTVLYGHGSAISGNQLYHVSALLLLQRKPKTLTLSKRPRSVLWHARQICAISASNAHHGCWTNALQPLWIAGKVMSHHSEHAAIVEILIRIERETGWATAWRVEDLKEFWGEYDDDYDIEMN